MFKAPKIERIIRSAQYASASEGCNAWTVDQQEALRHLLSVETAVCGLQGAAGSGKTSTVIRSYVLSMESLGYQVTGMAPSASACHSLAEGAGIANVQTIARHLLTRPLPRQHSQPRQLWIVDEVSMVSTKDLVRLLERASREHARVLLAGDAKQLEAVEAGAAFRLLREAGLPTIEINEIVRQSNPHLLDAVYLAQDGAIAQSFVSLDKGGGAITEIPGTSTERQDAIVKMCIEMTREQRQATLVIDPSRAGRDALNKRIREGLQSMGEIDTSSIALRRLDSIDLPHALTSDVSSYQRGDVIRFMRDYKRLGVAKNSYWRITDIDSTVGVLSLAHGDGRQLRWNPGGIGRKVQAYRSIESCLSVGDEVRFTANNSDLGVVNGSRGTVSVIDAPRGDVRVKLTSGKVVTVSRLDETTLHWNHDYVSTTYAAQGRTVDHVIYHGESIRHHLASQKALYVSLSRARHSVSIVTDDRQALQRQFAENTGEKLNALDMDGGVVRDSSWSLER